MNTISKKNVILELENISFGKKAEQSSRSKWSKPNDPDRALDITLDVDFAFHTDKEEHPWWILDLAQTYPIEKIDIYNRKKLQEKARTLSVEVSEDKVNWLTIHSGLLYWDDFISLPLGSKVVGRFIRLSLSERQYLHLRRVEVFKRKKPALIVAGRGDGLGGRLMAMLNALYISKNLDFEFGYVWPLTLNAQAKNFKAESIKDAYVIGHAIETEEDIFSSDFIKNYSKTGLINTNQGVLRKVKNEKFAMLTDTEYYENSWGWYAPPDPLIKLFSDIDADDLKEFLRSAWNDISFNEIVKYSLNSASNQAKKLDDFVAIHIRTGDIVFADYRFNGKQFMRKALPIGLADLLIKSLIDQGVRNIVLFGDEKKSIEMLKNKYKVNSIFDYYPKVFDSSSEQALFEIQFMSHAMKIFSSGSSFFSILAQTIGRDVSFESVYDLFSVNEQYSSLRKYVFQGDDSPPLIMAFNCFHCYVLGLETKTNDDLLPILERAAELDPLNPKYLIYQIDILVKADKIIEAEKKLHYELSRAQFYDKNFFIKVLTSYGGSRYFYSSSFKSFELGASKDLHWMSYCHNEIINKLGKK